MAHFTSISNATWLVKWLGSHSLKRRLSTLLLVMHLYSFVKLTAFQLCKPQCKYQKLICIDAPFVTPMQYERFVDLMSKYRCSISYYSTIHWVAGLMFR